MTLSGIRTEDHEIGQPSAER